MFNKIRQLRISLAAKCQILFGLAVVLIISSALSVPWQRMEQLTEQLNVRAASALADNAREAHIALRSAGLPDIPTSRPAVIPTNKTLDWRHPATQPAAENHDAFISGQAANLPPLDLPRLVSINPPHGDTPESRFERRAISHFAKNPDSLYYYAYYDRPDGSRGYRFATPLELNETCLGCHTTAVRQASKATSATASAPSAGSTSSPQAGSGRDLSTTLIRPPATQPATSPIAQALPLPGGLAQPIPLEVDPEAKDAEWVGLISVDFGSRIDTTQLLLNRTFILMAGLLAGVLAFFTFYFITTRLILQPVRVLQETAEKVAQGDLNIRSDIYTGDEFQQLSETFNVMLANLKQHADALQAVNKSLDLRLGQLAETNVGLYESNRLKSEFLANVSHELRTPLNSILGFADLLKDALPATSDPKDAKALRYISNIRQSGRNLLELINDLLDLAKIEAGRMEIRSEPLSLSDLFEGLATILKPLAEQKGVVVEPMVSANVPILHSDPGKLQQILYNLLSNAIKFSPEGGRIGLTADRIASQDPKPGEEGHILIRVVDQGPGIDPAKHAVIFEKFRQLDGSVTRTHSGTGLGLAISKELTTLLGGAIGVDSAPGEGAAFWIKLPLHLAARQIDVRTRMSFV
jgi:signal transduction histidine kinase